MNTKQIIKTLCATSFTLFATSVFAVPVSGYMEGWDTPGDLAGWGSNTTVSTVVQADPGGNPGGHIQTRGTGAGSFDVGALTDLSAVTGDFGGSLWTASVDLAFFSEAFTGAGSFDNAWLRFRYQDSSQNGWAYSLTNIFSPDWSTFSVTFDPSWSDADAMANGWLPDDQSISPTADPSQSWATTMSNVYTTEVRLSGEGDLLGGIDNFKLNAVPVPAAVWLFGSGLLGLLGVARRKHSV
jgi:hypothetical protein